MLNVEYGIFLFFLHNNLFTTAWKSTSTSRSIYHDYVFTLYFLRACVLTTQFFILCLQNTIILITKNQKNIYLYHLTIYTLHIYVRKINIICILSSHIADSKKKKKKHKHSTCVFRLSGINNGTKYLSTTHNK